MHSLFRLLIIAPLLASLLHVPTNGQESLADAARKNRAKGAQATRKKVWTDDDVAHANETEVAASAPTPESVSETLQRFRLLGKEELGAAVLGTSGLNVDFPNRKDWEQKLFDAKQEWVLQVDRMIAHKDAAKDSRDEELRLALEAQRNFQRIKGQGVQQARAVNDPVLKAHLDYQRQQDFCRQTSGDLRSKCEANLEQLKLKMQREGTW